MKSITLEIHTPDNGFRDVTDYVSTVTWRESVLRPWDSMTVTFRLPLGELFLPEKRRASTGRGEASAPVFDGVERTNVQEPGKNRPIQLRLGSWLKLIDDAGICRAFGRIPNRQIQYLASEDGALESTSSLSTESWLEFLNAYEAQVFPELRGDIGTLMGVEGERWEAYTQLYLSMLNDPSPAKIQGSNDSFRSFLNVFAPFKLPPTLFPGNATLDDVVRVAFDKASGAKHAPTRTMDDVPISPLGEIASLQPQGKVADLLFSVYQPEPRLIEFFPSLENGVPVLIHRFAPWRTGPLGKMVIDSGGNPVPLRGGRWDRVTWKLDGKLAIQQGQAYSISAAQQDTNRINAVSLNWSVGGASAGRINMQLGFPIYDRFDVDRHGVRVMEVNWNPLQFDQRTRTRPGFQTSGLSGGGGNTINQIFRGIGLMAWQFYGNGNVFESGNLETDFLGDDIVAGKARCGEPFSLDYGAPVPFTGYITAIEHSISIDDNAVTEATSTISFTRGLWDEDGRNPFVYLEDTVAVSEPAKEPQPEPVVQPPPFVISLALNTFLSVTGLGSGWAGICKAAGVGAIAGKVVSRDNPIVTGGFSQGTLAQLYAGLDAAGITREGHGLQLGTDVGTSSTAGVIAAQECEKWGLALYYANFDDAWYFESQAHTDTAIAFIDAFRNRAAQLGIATQLAWNGYVQPRGPSVNPQTIDINRIVGLCDMVFPMVYNFTQPAARNYFLSRAGRFNLPGGRGVMVGSGYEVPGKGYAGFYSGVDGYVSLVRNLANSNPLNRFAVWQNIATRITTANAVNPSLATAFQAMLDPTRPLP